MYTAHGCITELFTDKLSPAVPDADPDSSLVLAREAQIRAGSLRRILGNVMRRSIGRSPVLTQEEELAHTIQRLRELSPHLLDDIGVTISVVEDLEVLVVHPVQDQTPVAVPQTASRPATRPERASIRLPLPQAVAS
jgi:hypothetical protein